MRLPALVVDDDAQLRRFVRLVLEQENWDVTEAESAEEAFELLSKEAWCAVFCDVIMQGADGFAVLRKFREQLPKVNVVLMTGHGGATDALDATSFGAYDYLLKPFSAEDLRSLSDKLVDKSKNEPRSSVMVPKGRSRLGPDDLNLVGRSEAFINVMKLVGRVAPSDLPVLLTGESGTGKGVVAAALHRRSRRAGGPFVAVNCGSIPSELIEAELFGHVKGSFTGADRDRMGLWEEANGGTIFLDEITETSSSFQVKLLRTLQEGEIRRVGSNQTVSVDVRVVAASNRDVEEEVKAGRFRQDLFYRLNAMSIVLPPLRDRPSDILPLVMSFQERLFSKRPYGISNDVLDLLVRYPWPGNIRELENAVIRAAALSDGTIRPQDLPERVRNYQTSSVETTDLQDNPIDSISTRAWPSMFEVEGAYVERVMAHTKGNKQEAARLLDVDRKTIGRMVKRHNIVSKRNSDWPPRID
ncbi:MAG TPA: sigma-54 dependent transcriptional regulator [Pyrinomonadaceae bacterium]